MHPLAPDIAARLASSFPPAEVPAAVAVLAGAVREGGRPAEPRLQRCALVASAGSLERLQHFVRLLAVDYRDVVMAGEYEVQQGRLVQVRHLEAPFE